MKVAYNTCFGGFGLSPKAEILYAERKGIKLYPYTSNSGNTSYTRVEDIEGVTTSLDFLTEDLGDEVSPSDIHSSRCYYYQSFHGNDDLRVDPDLIAVIEELGEEEASGDYAELEIIEIPDGSRFEIEVYDGNEKVVPVRECW